MELARYRAVILLRDPREITFPQEGSEHHGKCDPWLASVEFLPVAEAGVVE
jgi:hypothetical protein